MKIPKTSKIWKPSNIYGNVEIGENCMIGTFCEIQTNVKIGDNTKIQSHSFVCSGVEIGKNCFIGHGVMFINDVYPPSGNPSKWKKTIIEDNVSIGSNATILPIKIGHNSLIGAGSVVTKDVPPNVIIAGNPSKILRRI